MVLKFVGGGDCRSAYYRGQHIDIIKREDPKAPKNRKNPNNLKNPRETTREKWLTFISTSKQFRSPDLIGIYWGNEYEPTGNFFGDIYRYITYDLAENYSSDTEYTSRAIQFLDGRWFVVPVILETKKESLDLIHSLSPSQGEKLVVAPVEQGGVDQNNPFLIGAFVATVSRARQRFGIDKTVEELRAAVVEIVQDELADFNAWLSGEVYRVALQPNYGAYTLIGKLGKDGERLAKEWSRDLECFEFNVWGSSDRYREKLQQLEGELDRFADWVAYQLDTIDDSDIGEARSTIIKTRVKAMLEKLEG